MGAGIEAAGVIVPTGVTPEGIGGQSLGLTVGGGPNQGQAHTVHHSRIRIRTYIQILGRQCRQVKCITLPERCDSSVCIRIDQGKADDLIGPGHAGQQQQQKQNDMNTTKAYHEHPS